MCTAKNLLGDSRPAKGTVWAGKNSPLNEIHEIHPTLCTVERAYNLCMLQMLRKVSMPQYANIFSPVYNVKTIDLEYNSLTFDFTITTIDVPAATKRPVMIPYSSNRLMKHG